MSVTADYFMQHVGVDAVTAAALVQQHTVMSGSPQSRAELEATLDVPVRSAPKDTHREAVQRLVQLGADPAAAESLARQEAELTRRQPVTEANSEALLEERLQQQFDEIMSPPDRPERYQLPYNTHATDQDKQVDAQIRQAFFDVQLPQFAGESIAAEVEKTGRTLQGATGDQLGAHAQAVRGQLERMWGAETEANIDTVDGFIAAAASRNPTVGQILNRAPQLLLNPIVFDQILQVAKHQAAMGRR